MSHPETLAQRQRDTRLYRAYALTKFKDRQKVLPQISEWIKRAKKAAPLSERQVNNLICELGHNTTMKILGKAI